MIWRMMTGTTARTTKYRIRFQRSCRQNGIGDCLICDGCDAGGFCAGCWTGFMAVVVDIACSLLVNLLEEGQRISLADVDGLRQGFLVAEYLVGRLPGLVVHHAQFGPG